MEILKKSKLEKEKKTITLKKKKKKVPLHKEHKTKIQQNRKINENKARKGAAKTREQTRS